MSPRYATLKRTTSETDVSVAIDLDGSGVADIHTGIGFLDHLLTAFAKHSRVDLTLECNGDLHVDDHHTAEDCGIMLGRAIDQALGERRDIARFGSAYAPLDESLARAVIDISGRGNSFIALGLERDTIGALSCENIPHVLQSLASQAGMTVHVDTLKGANDHHRAEAAFKAFALAFRAATRSDPHAGVASTKGVIDKAESS